MTGSCTTEYYLIQDQGFLYLQKEVTSYPQSRHDLISLILSILYQVRSNPLEKLSQASRKEKNFFIRLPFHMRDTVFSA
jgi:hypothetical protein